MGFHGQVSRGAAGGGRSHVREGGRGGGGVHMGVRIKTTTQDNVM